MAVTITVPQAALAIRAITDTTQLSGPVLQVLDYLFPAARELVLAHAETAPDAIHNAALVRVLGWLYDSDPSEGVPGQALRSSGAASILAQWRNHRAGVITGGEATITPATPGTGTELPPFPGPGNYILAVDNGVLRWVEFPIP